VLSAHRRSRGVLTSALLAATLLVAAISPALGHHGSGPKWAITAVAAPGTVSAGDVVAFNITVSNLGDSDGDPVHLVAATPAGAAFLGGSVSAGLCTPGLALDCSLPLTTLGTSRTAQAVYRAPASGVSLAVTFKASTDDPMVTATGTAAISTDPNVASRYVFDSSSLTVSTDQAISAANPQSTLVNSPTTGIVVSVTEAAGTAICPTSRPCFSQESVLSVGGGATYPAGFKVVLKLDASEIPHGVTWWNIGVAHQFDNGSWEILSHCKCSWWGSPPTSVPCFTARPLWGGDIEITVWLTQNGKLRGF
jgi:uncharacterized repeat protein (TIGR01451 family)